MAGDHPHPAHRPGPAPSPPVRPYEATRRAIKAWRSLGASRWVIRTIQRGVQIPWLRKPPRFHSRGYSLNKADAKWAEAELERWLAAGYLREMTEEEATGVHCLMGGFVTHSAGKPRLVVDYRHPNAYMERRRFKYETLWELAPGLGPDDELISWDIADAYHHLRLRVEDQTFLCFTMLGRFFAPVSMPFGLALAPYTWTKVCQPVVGRLRELGFRLTAYVDDSGGRPPVAVKGSAATKEDARRGWRTAETLLRTLGLKVHENKGVRDGTTELPLLGHVVDTRLGVFRLQPKRVSKIESIAVAILRRAARHRRWVRLGTLRSFCGAAVSTTLSVPQARYRTQALFAAMRPLLREDGTGRGAWRDLRLPHQALSDLRWWSRLSTHALLGRAMWPAPDDAVMHTDASLTGWGAAWNGTVPARGFHSPQRRHLHINVHELAAVRLGLQSFVPLLRQEGTAVRLMMDSLVGVQVVNNGTSCSEALTKALRMLRSLCELHGVQLRASFLPSAVNYVADRLSRHPDRTDWSLSDAGFRRLERLHGPHTVDLFATQLNYKCGRYYSATADPGTAGVDAMTKRWTGENCWCNPPFQLLGPVVDKILRDQATVTLIAPVWRSQAWWHRAREACTEWEVLPSQEGVFTHGSPSRPASRPTWEVAAFRFVGAATPFRA